MFGSQARVHDEGLPSQFARCGNQLYLTRSSWAHEPVATCSFAGIEMFGQLGLDVVIHCHWASMLFVMRNSDYKGLKFTFETQQYCVYSEHNIRWQAAVMSLTYAHDVLKNITW
jgi:hypothetical protein